MTTTQKQDSQEKAREILEKFGLEKKLNEIFNHRDESLSYILAANIGIFGVSATVVFATNEETLTASFLLVMISAIITLVGAMLNIWYLVRLKKRLDFLKKEQEKVLQKTEIKLIKTFDLLAKIIKSNIFSKVEILKEKGVEKLELLDILKKDSDLDFLAEDSSFIPFTIMELAHKETIINIEDCLNKPLNEKYSEFKLFIDRLSDKSKNWALILGSAFMMVSLLVKFIIG